MCGSSETGWSPVSSSKESEEEDMVDLGSVFIFQPENKKIFIPEETAGSDLKELEVDLELRLFSGPSKIEMPIAVAAHGDKGSCCWETEDPWLSLHNTHTAATVVTKSSMSSSVASNSVTKGVKGRGGGQRCQFLGRTVVTKSSMSSSVASNSVTKGAKGRGGGQRCQFLGCTRRAKGRTDFCIAHGGGKRCAVPGCTKRARGRTEYCVRHGGGKRCKFEGCGKSAQGTTDFCIVHGSAKRCAVPGCTESAGGETDYCASHAGA